MFDLNLNTAKIWTKIGASVTILVLVAACSSKQVINEASIQEPAQLNDTVADQNPYVDQSELPVREQEERKVTHKRASTKKKSHKRHVAHKPVKHEDQAAAAIGSIENTPSMPTPPPPPEQTLGESTMDQQALEESTSLDFSGLILENWIWILGLIGLGTAGYLGFRFYSKRGSSKRKSKRRLVFN
jgi:hypothetical protein